MVKELVKECKEGLGERSCSLSLSCGQINRDLKIQGRRRQRKHRQKSEFVFIQSSSRKFQLIYLLPLLSPSLHLTVPNIIPGKRRTLKILNTAVLQESSSTRSCNLVGYGDIGLRVKIGESLKLQTVQTKNHL